MAKENKSDLDSPFFDGKPIQEDHHGNILGKEETPEVKEKTEIPQEKIEPEKVYTKTEKDFKEFTENPALDDEIDDDAFEQPQPQSQKPKPEPEKPKDKTKEYDQESSESISDLIIPLVFEKLTDFSYAFSKIDIDNFNILLLSAEVNGKRIDNELRLGLIALLEGKNAEIKKALAVNPFVAAFFMSSVKEYLAIKKPDTLSVGTKLILASILLLGSQILNTIKNNAEAKVFVNQVGEANGIPLNKLKVKTAKEKILEVMMPKEETTLIPA